MLNFDQVLFYTTYNNLIEHKSFNDIFYEIFIPLLEEIGLLWQTDTITPAHEHFITAHIKQKILINIERLQILEPKPKSKTFILFLPDNEVHDIGLLFIKYQLRSKGYHTIFLGESVPMNSLLTVLEFFNDITFISYFTVKPEHGEISNYINDFDELLLKDSDRNLLLLGPKLKAIEDTDTLPKSVILYDSIENLVKEL